LAERVYTRDDQWPALGDELRDENVSVRNRPPITRAAGKPAVHAAVARALEALERAGVHWCLLRGESDLGSPEGDVDLLVAGGDMRRLRRALAPVGFVPLRAWGRGPHRFFVWYDEASACGIKLDVVTEFAFDRYQELRTAAAAGCLARRRYIGALALLAPGDAFWALLLHCMLDRESFSVGHRGRLLDLAGAADCDSELGRVAQAVFGERRGAATLLELVRAEDWGALTAIAKEAPVGWPRRRRLVIRLRVLTNRALRRASNVLSSGPR
jgi:hypothetical protein